MQKRTTKDNKARPKKDGRVLDVIVRDGERYFAVESLKGYPCGRCCFNPCSSKPADFEPCPGYLNRYHTNIFYKRVLNIL